MLWSDSLSDGADSLAIRYLRVADLSITKDWCLLGTFASSHNKNMSDETREPNQRLFLYDDYREFLKDEFSRLQSQDKKMTHRVFAKMAGFKSPGYLLMVISAKANLSADSIQKLSKALKFNRDESYYFKYLVLLNQATELEDKLVYAHQVLKSKGFKQARPLAESQYRYYSHWYYAAIKELAALPGFKEDPRWIANKLASTITIEQAKLALEELFALGVLKRDGQDIKVVQEVIVTQDEVTQPLAVQFHEGLLQLAAQSIRRFPRDEREITGITFGVSKKSFEDIKEITRRFRKEVVEVLLREQEATGVYQLGIQLFPLAPFEKDPNVNESEGS